LAYFISGSTRGVNEKAACRVYRREKRGAAPSQNFVIDKRIVHQLFIIKRQDKITFAFFQVEHGVVDVNRFNMKSFILSVGITGDDFRQ
jgi:hypothetical protein